MDRATEQQLATLHGKVAESMTAALDNSSRAIYLLSKHEDLPKDVKKFLMDASDVNPSLLTAITKFLKDNNISADMDQNNALSTLKDSLDRKKASVTKLPYGDE